ncbi:MAG TPA: FAD:protein FMN transferase [Verrucomicrobiales bacterium]|nr:FAD:protein FMN transferase [Verrucomicrobiales bacterium]
MSAPALHRFSHEAMATRFEVTLVHHDAGEAASAAQAVWDDIDAIEAHLSRFIPHSDISCLNGSEAGRVVDVHEAAMDCLSYGKEIWEQTGGAFDVTIGPLQPVLRWPDGHPRKHTPEELEEARSRCGYHLLDIDPVEFTVVPRAPNMQVDLGAIGKGYALDQAANILREQFGITNALLNAGTSTVLGVGSMPEKDGWLVRAGAPEPFALHDEAVSGTGFQVKGAHVIDPRTAKLVDMRRIIRWSIAPNATLADALSTAFMVMNRREITAFCRQYPEVRVVYCDE